MYATSFGRPAVAVTRPFDKQAATRGNGTMVALVLKSRAEVDALQAKALSLGGRDEGEPGVRGEEGPHAFYGACFGHQDGNKLCADHIGQQ